MPDRIMGVIPARIGSTRLPRKVLRHIAGHPMVYWVYKSASECQLLSDLIVATDSEEVATACKSYGIPVMITGEHHTGSDRIHEVMTRTDYDIYLSIQGDEPTITQKHVTSLVQPLLLDQNTQASTLRVLITHEAADDPNVVKVVCSVDGFALYFSRSRIPYCRDSRNEAAIYKHLGLYAYRRDTLERFSKLEQTPLEKSESLEQLRLLENGIKLYVGVSETDTVGVDTEEDLTKAEKWLAGAQFV